MVEHHGVFVKAECCTPPASHLSTSIFFFFLFCDILNNLIGGSGLRYGNDFGKIHLYLAQTSLRYQINRLDFSSVCIIHGHFALQSARPNHPYQ